MKKHLLFFGIVALICLTSCSTSEGAKKDNSSIEEKYYTITWKNYDNTILEVDENVKEGTVPTYDGTAPIREDDEEYTYTWTGWAPEVKAATSNQIYTATYQSNKITNYHTVTFDTHGGSGIPPQKVEHGYKITKPEDPTKLGYAFACWTYQEEEWSFLGYSVTEDMTLDANWDIVIYSVNYILDGGVNSSSNPKTFNIENDIILQDATKTGYTFLGWFDENGNKIIQLGRKAVEIAEENQNSLNLYARWSANLNVLSVASEDTSKGTVAITSGSGYTDEEITIKALPKEGFEFGGWYSGSVCLSYNDSFSFTMPSHDVSLTAHFLTIEEKQSLANKLKDICNMTPKVDLDSMTVSYGIYPQSHVRDNSIISALNNMLILDFDNVWYLYNEKYYAHFKTNNYWWDPWTDENRNNGPRFSDNDKMYNHTDYWFECEPITWNILSNNDNEYFLLSSVVLDQHPFNRTLIYYNESNETKETIRVIDGKEICYNNYQHSDVRKWLNNDFYNSVFNTFLFGDNYIKTTLVDNSASTTDSLNNPYFSDNTEDKVFLLSYQDYTNPDYGFSSDSTAKDLKRKCLQSDYAASKDLYDGNSDAYYWTRSPYYYNPRYNSNCEVRWYVNAITPMEDYNQRNKYSIEGYSYIFDSRYLDEPGGIGVRPAITIEL